ncbi:MAG: 4Fe-4S dicluster domain-containing protein [Bacteroidota bacterium]
MFTIFNIIKHQGKQYIPDVTKVTLPAYHPGKPHIENKLCSQNCNDCVQHCPVKAIDNSPLRIDLSKCVFCSDCENICPEKKIQFTPDFKIASNTLENLVVTEGIINSTFFNPDIIRKEIKRCFGRSLKLRLVSNGSCNGCELELNAAGNVNFDMGRYGIEFLASPRHCDGVVITGPLVKNSEQALELTYKAIPQPRIIILVGACAISGGIFADSSALNRSFLDKYKPDLYIPGCPVHPLTFINGILELIK